MSDPPLLRRRFTIPALPSRVISRDLLESKIADAIERTPLTIVSATAGSGKTTSVLQALQTLDQPVAWLTLDSSDGAPGRLLTYLEAAIATAVPLDGDPIQTVLADGAPHPEAAGLLLQSVEDQPLIFVLDEIDRIQSEPSAWSVLEALVRYRPDPMRLVLISRRPVQLGLQAVHHDMISWVLEEDLAFDTNEIRTVLEVAGNHGSEPEEVMRATGGWVTGVVFDAWRRPDAPGRLGGATDPLHGYLASQILAELPADDQEFLVRTSLLSEVDTRQARALGIEDAELRLDSLREANLPGTWSPDASSFRCHSRFREFLESLLAHRPVREVQELYRRLGSLLAAEGLAEEAVEPLLRADAIQDAAELAASVLPSILERADLEKADRWLGRFRVLTEPPLELLEAEVVLAAGREEFGRVVHIADDLARMGRLEELASKSSRTAALMAWASAHAGRLDVVHRIVAMMGDSSDATAIGYMLHLIEPADEGSISAPDLSGGPLDALVLRDHYIYGRLDRVLAEPGTGWIGGVATPWRIAALRATGRVGEAVALLQEAQESGLASLGLVTVVAPEVRLDAGDPDLAWAMVEEALPVADGKGSDLFACLNRCAAAKIAVRGKSDPTAAIAMLDELATRPAGAYRYVQELAGVWRGFALLGEDDHQALPVLERSVDSMVSGDRILELPTAATYLSEARWRAGDESGSDDAADLAFASAQKQGSDHLLIQALADFPAVLSRRLDAEPLPDSPWHRLGRSLHTGTLASPSQKSVLQLHDLGKPTMVRDGVPVRARLSKAVELLAYLKTTPGNQASRDELLEALFGGRVDASARSYLRQAVHWLRQALPPDSVETDSSSPIRLLQPEAISSDADAAVRALEDAGRLHGSEGLSSLRRGLALLANGEYLDGCESGWAVSRREELSRLADRARCSAAELAFTEGSLGEAMKLADEVLNSDPYNETMWRLRMRAAGALGNESEVIESFRRCRAALEELGTDVAPATTSLLQSLRR